MGKDGISRDKNKIALLTQTNVRGNIYKERRELLGLPLKQKTSTHTHNRLVYEAASGQGKTHTLHLCPFSIISQHFLEINGGYCEKDYYI